jgi:enterochelin esterase family protein
MVHWRVGRLLTAFLLTSAAVAAGQEAEREMSGEAEGPRSARLTALAAALRAGEPEALTGFWEEIQGKAPLLEPAAAPGERRVTFVWRGEAQTVALLGGRPGGEEGVKWLARLPGSDLWHRTETHPADARFSYNFAVNLPRALPETSAAWNRLLARFPPRPDPLAARVADGGSYAELPEAPPQPWVAPRSGVPRGSVARHAFRSTVMEAEYSLNVYTPPGDDAREGRSWLMIAFDGGFPAMEATLDNLLSEGKIPPLVVVGIENISLATRTRDLGASPRFARFLVEELVPWARATYRVDKGPSRTIVAGISRGGLMAAYCGLEHARVFGKVLSLSGAFENPPERFAPLPIWADESSGWIIRQFAQAPRRPVTFYMECGRYDLSLPLDRLGLNRRLRDVLEAKGYRVTYREFNGGHDRVCWQGAFANGVLALAGERPA